MVGGVTNLYGPVLYTVYSWLTLNCEDKHNTNMYSYIIVIN